MLLSLDWGEFWTPFLLILKEDFNQQVTIYVGFTNGENFTTFLKVWLCLIFFSELNSAEFWAEFNPAYIGMEEEWTGVVHYFAKLLGLSL